MRNILVITGGAGFIGTNLIRKLLQEGNYEITVIDNFNKQIHGQNHTLQNDLIGKVKLVIGDITDKNLFKKVLIGQDIIVHFAAETGTGQSMYDIAKYTDINISATAFLCDYLVNEKHNISKIILASSRSIYGEGKYFSSEYGIVYPNGRTKETIKKSYEVLCPISFKPDLKALPTDEDSKIHPSSFYGITKQVQEQLLLLTAKIKNIPIYTFRFQNVFGPGQSLKNPYTGILSIFTRLALKNETINIFEDGDESRDFVFVEDVVDAVILALNPLHTGSHILNVGSGIPTSVLEVANEIVQYLGSKSKVVISGDFREGDIRHNYADLTNIENSLGYKPKWTFANGLREFLDWVKIQEDLPLDNSDYNTSIKELEDRGLLISK
jgi:dTDP-L-rhamnose 4-epimerase